MCCQKTATTLAGMPKQSNSKQQCVQVCSSVQVMVFAVLHSANTECGNMLLQPDADGMTGRPQVAAVICRFRIFRSTSHWEHVLRQEPRDRLDLDRMHTGIDKAWSTQRPACSNCSTAHSAASVAAG
jgi:hypothetical protein